MIDPLQLSLIPVRTIQGVLMIIIANILRGKAKIKKNEGIGYKLCLLYMYGFYSFGIGMIINAIEPAIAPLSLTSNQLMQNYNNVDVIVGYHTDIPSLFISNVMRDFELGFAFIYIVLLFGATQVIIYGEKTGLKRLKNKFLMVLLLFIGISVIIADKVVILISNGNSIKVNFSWDLLSPFEYLGFFFYIILNSYNGLAILVQYMKSRNVTDEKSKAQLKWFIVGYFIIFMVLWYWVIGSFFENSLPYPNLVLFYYIGHIVWILGPIAIYRGVNYQKEPFEKLEPNQKEKIN